MREFTHKQKLHWVLVGIGAIAIMAVWVPHMATQVSAFGQGIQQATESNGAKEAQASLASIANSFGKIPEVIKNPEMYSGADLKEKQLSILAEQIKNNGTPAVVDEATLPQAKDVEAPQKDTDPARAFCTRNSGRYQQRTKGALKYGVCKFNDSSECLATQYMNGQCAPSMTAVAEDLMEKIPDLVMTVGKTGYCKGRTTPPDWTNAKLATAICFEGIKVQNQGWAASPATTVTMAGHEYPVPALAPGQTHALDSATFTLLTRDMVASAVVDRKNEIKEFSEGNNKVQFPAQ